MAVDVYEQGDAVRLSGGALQEAPAEVQIQKDAGVADESSLFEVQKLHMDI